MQTSGLRALIKGAPQVIAQREGLPQRHAVQLRQLAVIIVPRGPGNRVLGRCLKQAQKLIHCLQKITNGLLT